ncbi:hypothetical protein HAX54_030697 [Datura stramonium]|uniref:Uncharacterized protein n=1 Tax=Datura stramonium TaxID=4076 RepID=A0ABS8SBI1_DATST|nr:hypothetical protein [Datura stramonium]
MYRGKESREKGMELRKDQSDKSEWCSEERQKRKRQVEDKKELQPKTPLASTIERPVRQRKSVERLVASIELELTKEIHIEKVHGSWNCSERHSDMAYKLSKRKTDDTLKLLHTILFGRRGKAAQFKSNISRFSGFVWHENEIYLLREASSKKEDLESQLMDFLDAPHPTTSGVLAEKDQSEQKESFVNRVVVWKGSAKSHKTEGASSKAKKKKKKNVHEPKDESEENDQEEGPEVMKANSVQERSDDEMSNLAEVEEKDSESEEESEKDKKKHKQNSINHYPNKEPAGEEESSEWKGHKKADKLRPSDDELRSAICEVLKRLDFNTKDICEENMVQDGLLGWQMRADEEGEEENAEEDEKQLLSEV